jgi:energy-coupling factor transporter ATP-binding protein EcfA2
MKAALLCVLAPRPKLLLMDEPFSGMDAIVKDELVRGLLESAGAEGWTVLLSSHDIGELELLADRVGIIAEGCMRLNATMDEMRARFKRVEVTASGPSPANGRRSWMSVERSGNRLGFVADTSDENALASELSRRFPAARLEVSGDVCEVFAAVASRTQAGRHEDLDESIAQMLHVARKDLRESRWQFIVYARSSRRGGAGHDWWSPSRVGDGDVPRGDRGAGAGRDAHPERLAHSGDAFWATRLALTAVLLAKILLVVVIVVGLPVAAQAFAISSFDIHGAALVRHR